MSTRSILSRITRQASGTRAVGMLGVLAVSFSLLTVPSPAADAASGGLEGQQLEYPSTAQFGYVAGIDPKTRIMYAAVQDPAPDYRIAAYDLKSDVPKLVRMSGPGVTNAGLFSPYRVIIDSERQRMLVITTKDTGGRSKIDVIDLKTLTLQGSWDLGTIVPGFLTTGFTYDKAADRIYLAGDFTGSTNTGSINRVLGTKVTGQGSAIVALEAETGAFAWVHLMPRCDSVLDGATTGTMIARSIYRPALYVFCFGGSAAYQPTGQNGLVRVDISTQAQASKVANFPSEFFPISGTYFESTDRTGVAAFDPGSERFFAQSLANRTPGTWVFDGLRNSWVGFIAAPDNHNTFYGLNTENGRYYMAGNPNYAGSGYVAVTDGRSTPAAQGNVFTDIYVNGQMIADPATNRVFMPSIWPVGVDENGMPQLKYGLLMLRDNSEAIVPLPDVDLDKLTRDLPDDKALLQFSAGASGFGARYVAIGGWESAYDRISTKLFPQAKDALGSNPAQLAYGDRGLTFAAAPAVDIRPSGASATAAGGTIDQASQSDRQDKTPAEVKDAEVPVTSLAGGLTCLDGGGERQEHKAGNGDPERVSVVCDLDKLTASGTAAFAEDVNGGGQSLASSSFTTRTFRDGKRGVVTETTAVARGIALRDPSGKGSIAIKRVTAVATTFANGRPGSTQAIWERRVEGAVITNDGQEQRPRSCTTTVATGRKDRSEGDCAALEAAINGLSSRLQVRFPMPRLTATPRGAFARVEERETDYLNSLTTNNDQSRAIPAMEVVLYNDGPEKGRLLVQMAAIDANATFVRSLLSEPPTYVTPTPTGGETDGGSGTSTTTGGTAGGTTSGAGDIAPGGEADFAAGDTGFGTGAAGDLAAEVAPGSSGLTAPGTGTGALPVMGWLIGARAPREAAMAIGIWLLFAGALMGAWRRRRLIETVGS